ncbi:MAG TPA: hypothetical protein VFP94_05115, partial [Terriglobales bacterium]|nr:hypothetical protein [Terriglobales bacterium]
MTARLWLAVLLVAGGGAAVRQAAAPPAPAPPVPLGTLHFTAAWRLLPAGTASLTWSESSGGL